jgi:uncharacterized protein (TIGR00369 family)
MSDEIHYRKLENMYHGAACNEFYTPTLTISEGKAEVVIPIKPAHLQGLGVTHGMVYFKAMDDASYFAAASLVKDEGLLTSSYTVYFLRPISQGQMRSVGKVVNHSRSQLIAEAVVYDDQDRQIARGSGVFAKSKIPYTAEIGYR